jgi:aldehyde dehydrogenase (NAD+)
MFHLATGKVITKLHEASPKDVDAAVDAAQKAFDTVWGLNTTGVERGKFLLKLADLMDDHNQELASIESLDNGACYFSTASRTLTVDVSTSTLYR